jgi:hypothetical protein
MTLHERLMLLRAIQVGNIPDTNDHRLYPWADVDARAVEQYNLIVRARVKQALELEIENALRCQFPGHSVGTYGRLPRWIDELGLMGANKHSASRGGYHIDTGGGRGRTRPDGHPHVSGA